MTKLLPDLARGNLRESRRRAWSNHVHYELLTRAGRPITTHSRLRPGDGAWIIGVSVSSGCRVGCTYCPASEISPVASLTADEMIGQVVYAHDRPLGASDMLTIAFNQMGDALLDLAEVLKAVDVLESALPKAEFALSTAFPKPREESSSAAKLLRPLWKRRERGVRIRLRISCLSTCDAARRRLRPNSPIFSLEDIAETVRFWHGGTSTPRTMLRFLSIESNALEAETVARLFRPDQVEIRIDCLGDWTRVGRAAGHCTRVEKAAKFRQDLARLGFSIA